MQCRVPRSVILRLVAEFLGCPYHPNFLPRVRPRKVLAKAHARQEYRDWREPQAEHHHNEFCADGLLIIRLRRSVRDAIHCFSGTEALAVFIQGGSEMDSPLTVTDAPRSPSTRAACPSTRDNVWGECSLHATHVLPMFRDDQFLRTVRNRLLRWIRDGRYSPGGGRWSRR